ncbi:MAG: GGDEF domain-containing protein [Bacillota bacterium]|nr:GGDEF domain-containing protein [Bacillota bacterium]
MTIEELKSGDANELYQQLRLLILSAPMNGKQVIQEFRDCDRYQDDFLYRLAVDSASLIAHGVMGEHPYVASMAPELIERAAAIGHVELEATNWINLGTTYGILDSLERALECYCHVINIEEKRNQVTILSSVAYYNLSLLYFTVEGYEKSLDYIERAIQVLDAVGERSLMYASRSLNYLSAKLQMLCRTGRVDQADAVYDKLKTMDYSGLVGESKFAYYAAELYYICYTTDGMRSREAFDRLFALIDGRDLAHQYTTIHAFVGLCEKLGYPIEIYRDLLERAADLPDTASNHVHLGLYRSLREYYRMTGDREKFEAITEKYIQYLERAKESGTEQQRSSLETVEVLMFGHRMTETSTRNVELKLLANEAIKTKNALQEAYNKLEKISSMDGLTQISSRREFEKRFLEQLSKAEREKQSVAVYMVDIDNFKVYNDTYGHLEGDEVLKAVARIFRENLDGSGGLSARFGGEEFIGAIAGLSEEQSERIGEKILRDIQALGIENRSVPLGVITVSVGIAFAETIRSGQRSELMRLADISLYEAKNTGKNRAVLRRI